MTDEAIRRAEVIAAELERKEHDAEFIGPTTGRFILEVLWHRLPEDPTEGPRNRSREEIREQLEAHLRRLEDDPWLRTNPVSLLSKLVKAERIPNVGELIEVTTDTPDTGFSAPRIFRHVTSVRYELRKGAADIYDIVVRAGDISELDVHKDVLTALGFSPDYAWLPRAR